jgi:hypothetical protein
MPCDRFEKAMERWCQVSQRSGSEQGPMTPHLPPSPEEHDTTATRPAKIFRMGTKKQMEKKLFKSKTRQKSTCLMPYRCIVPLQRWSCLLFFDCNNRKFRSCLFSRNIFGKIFGCWHKMTKASSIPFPKKRHSKNKNTFFLKKTIHASSTVGTVGTHKHRHPLFSFSCPHTLKHAMFSGKKPCSQGAGGWRCLCVHTVLTEDCLSSKCRGPKSPRSRDVRPVQLRQSPWGLSHVTRATKTAPSEAPLHPTPLLVTGARKKKQPSESIRNHFAKRRLVFLACLTGHVGHSSFVTAKTKKR